MLDAVPERADETRALWSKYDPAVLLVSDAKRITLDADRDRIRFDPKTWDVSWLIGFAGWKAVECYTPHVLLACATDQRILDVIRDDPEVDEVERAYKERMAAVQSLIDAEDFASAHWPPDLPRPNSDRNAFADPQYQTVFDLTGSAVAFTLFHEFRHVMLDQDKSRPKTLPEEELACDVWARDFATAHLAKYAGQHDHPYAAVLRRRSMAFALAALIFHEITPVWDRGGNKQYFSVGTRMEALLDNTPLPDNSPFWLFAASLLLGVCRQQRLPLDDLQPGSAKALTRALMGRI